MVSYIHKAGIQNYFLDLRRIVISNHWIPIFIGMEARKGEENTILRKGGIEGELF